MAKQKPSGTREWSQFSQNCHRILHKNTPAGSSDDLKLTSFGGCLHDCRYCYGRAALVRRGKIRPEQWADPTRHTLDLYEVLKRRPHRTGVTMFPTMHDIWPALAGSAAELGHTFEHAGSPLLVVSKPHIEVIEQLTHAWNTPRHRALIAFRFTITTCDGELASFWEPGAPKIAERLEAARLAVAKGFRVSFSVEPMLDVETTPRLLELLHDISPQGELWVGTMRRPRQRVKIDCEQTSAALDDIVADQTPRRVAAMVERVAAMRGVAPRVRWKDSVQEIMGFHTPAEMP